MKNGVNEAFLTRGRLVGADGVAGSHDLHSTAVLQPDEKPDDQLPRVGKDERWDEEDVENEEYHCLGDRGEC